MLGKTAKLGFQLVDISTSAGSVKASGRVPPGSELLPARDNPDQHYLLNKRVLISGEMLKDARPSFDGQTNEAVVAFTLNSTGAERFGRVTAQNIGRPFAIVLDDEVISAPVIRSQIFANGQISGGFSVEETNELSLLLRSGALPAPLLVVEERSVGPGLGSDSIKAGQVASIVGLAGVAFIHDFQLWDDRMPCSHCRLYQYASVIWPAIYSWGDFNLTRHCWHCSHHWYGG